MTSDERATWAETQARGLIAAGVDALDAENTVKRILAQVPEHADPATWMPAVDVGDVELGDAEVADARADWYMRVEPKFARLLDATETES